MADNGTVHCPAALIAAPSSGAGKTTVTAALARYHRDQGRRVRVFKAGPDYLDPMIHERATGCPVDNVDLWMVGAEHSRALLFEAAAEADLILIECGMGLFDGNPSSADLAEALGVPVLAVIDARGLAQTAGAVAHGLAHYRPSLPFAGVIANRVASDNHDDLLRRGMPDDVPYYGGIRRSPELGLPERHLGLVSAGEIDDLESRLAAGARAIEAAGVTALPAPVAFNPVEPAVTERLLDGVRIGVARDAAFAFIYPANIDLLRRLGAEIHEFSPLADAQLPEVDALWLPGGYPELHLEALAANAAMRASIAAHHAADKPVLAECGGLLYLLDRLIDRQGNEGRMLGLLPGTGTLGDKLAGLGLQSLERPEGTLRGHTFHYTRLAIDWSPWCHARRQRGDRPGEPVYRRGRLIASYLHGYFPSNPALVAAWLGGPAAAA